MWDVVDLPFWWWKDPENWSGPQPSVGFEVSVTNIANFAYPVTLSVVDPDPTGHHVSAVFAPATMGTAPFTAKLVLKLNSLPPIQEDIVIRAEGGGMVKEATVTVIWDVNGLRFIPVHVIMAAMDDGSDAPVMAVSDIQWLLSGANRVYGTIEGGMGIRFIFDPAVDLETVTDTDLQRDNPNGTQDPHDPPFPADFSNARTDRAHQYKGKVVIYFRNHHDDDPHYAGAGNFSSSYGDYVVLHPDTSRYYLFAHEVGHYLGLSHPFGGLHDELYAAKTMFDRRSLAATRIKNAVQDDKVPLADVMETLFDGDGIADTPPDEPALFGEGIDGEDMLQSPTCELQVGITVPDASMPLKFRVDIHTVILQPDKDNVMGYYPVGANPFHITAQQGSVVREALETGNRKDLFIYNW